LPEPGTPTNTYTFGIIFLQFDIGSLGSVFATIPQALAPTAT
jgi:hypothetical protein